MAPLLGFKRALPPDPQDTGNRVSKSTSTTSRANKPSILKACSSPGIAEALHRSMVLDPEQSIIYEEDFPSLEELDSQKKNPSYADSNKTTQGDRSKTPLMEKIKGLLDLTNFLAILAEGASSAMREQRVYMSTQNPQKNKPSSSMTNWAAKKAGVENGQSKEDRRVIIRLGQNHEARKCNPFQLRQTIQKLVLDKGLISDVWTVPSGIAIIALTPSKAAAIMQYKKEIETRFGKATFEQQETWTKFVIRPISKKIRGLDGSIDPMNGSLLEKLGSIRDHVPIPHIGWTSRSLDDEVNGIVSTHSRGGTLDLAFCIDRNAKYEVRTEFHTTSDHETLVTTIYKDLQLRAAGKLRNKALNDEIFHQLLKKTNNDRTLETQEELRIEAADLIKNIHTAITGACLRSKPRNFGNQWWTDEYKKASQIYRMARITGPAEFEKRELRATVRRAKKFCWNSV
ncbi:hypothetical protein EPUL_005211, partial [Erysiphe pulchra]